MFLPSPTTNGSPAPAPRPLALAGVALAYMTISLLGQLLAQPDLHIVSPVFPAAGVALAAVVSLGPRAAWAVAAGSILANLVTFPANLPAWVAVLALLAIGAGAAVGARVGARIWLPLSDPPLSRPRDVLRLGLAALGGCFVSALVGALAVTLAGSVSTKSFGEVALTWWLGDASGAIIVAPVLLVPRLPVPERAPLPERALLVVFFVLVSAIVFVPHAADLFLAHLYMPLLAWAALRIGVRGTVDTAGATALAATIATALGRGPFADTDRTLSLLILQSYLGTVSLTTLALGASVAERRRTQEALEEARRALEGRVTERTGQLARTVQELQAEAQSRAAAEAQLHATVEHMPFLVYAVDSQGRITLQNAAARGGFGDLIGKTLEEAGFPPEVLTHWNANRARALAGEVTRGEATYTLGGERRTFIEVLAPIRVGGQVLGVVGGSLEVTAQRRTEEELRASEETYREIFQGTNDAIFVHDIETGATIDANRAAERLSGRTVEELRGGHVRHFASGEPGYTPEDTDRWLAKARDDGPQTFEWRGIGADGQPRWVEVTLKRATIGGGPRILAAVRDIDERKRSEERRTRAETQLRMVLDHSPIILFGLDRDGRFTLTEGQGLQRLGRSAGEATGKDIYTRYAGEDQFLAAARRALAGESFAGRVELRRRASAVFEVHWTALFDAEGNPNGALAVALDVTERAKVEADRERLFVEEQALRAQAEEAVRTRDDFLSIASHELRTPLTSLRFAVESLVHLARSPGLANAPGPFVEHALGAADRQARRLTRLVDLLLDVSRANEGRLELAYEETDLGQLARSAVEALAAEAEQAGSALSVEVRAPVVLSCDKVRIEQVVTNLLSNAIKYGAGQPVEVAVETDAELARLSVRDRGIGIAPDQHETIFGRFERAVSVRHYGGLGLGLYIVRRIVEAHRGRVRVDSRPGEGATFVVELPRAQEREGT